MAKSQNKGPWTHRLLTYVFTLLLGLLIYWLLDFILADIGNLPGPSYAELEAEMLDGSLVDTGVRLRSEIEDVKRRIATERDRQQLLRDSTDNSQTTMNQLLDLQRLNLQKDMTPSDNERQALAESEQLFLENQRRYQALNDQISQLREQERRLEDELRASEAALAEARLPVDAKYQRDRERHRLRVASYKLLFLTPMLLVGVFLYLRFRAGTYWAIIYAFGVAVLIKAGFVMHEYFPRQYFKYVLILATLAVALRILVYLLRLVAHPKQDWLVKQYREAYEAFLCPICSHPIRRGPLKYMSWTRRSIRRVVQPLDSPQIVDEPYTCPACSTCLYAPCESCDAVRHALLPACEKCGDVISLV